VTKISAPAARDKLVQAGSELIRRNGYVATSVDDVCGAVGMTKGAFFHYFKTKEDLAQACLEQWKTQMSGIIQSAPFQELTDPLEKILGCMDFFVGVFSNPKHMKSCLAGTVVQEVSETHPTLRKAANACFVSGEKAMKSLLDDACAASGKNLDTAALAGLWIATLQGSLILSKASRNSSVVAENLKQLRRYITMLLTDRSA
jgi:TetR/AcrR family transcriptional repressor of nem operon